MVYGRPTDYPRRGMASRMYSINKGSGDAANRGHAQAGAVERSSWSELLRDSTDWIVLFFEGKRVSKAKDLRMCRNLKVKSMCVERLTTTTSFKKHHQRDAQIIKSPEAPRNNL